MLFFRACEHASIGASNNFFSILKKQRCEQRGGGHARSERQLCLHVQVHEECRSGKIESRMGVCGVIALCFVQVMQWKGRVILQGGCSHLQKQKGYHTTMEERLVYILQRAMNGHNRGHNASSLMYIGQEEGRLWLLCCVVL